MRGAILFNGNAETVDDLVRAAAPLLRSSRHEDPEVASSRRVLLVTAAWAERESAAAALQYTEQARVSAAEGYRVAVDLFQVGEATTTDILDAEYEQVSSTLSAINTKIDLKIANLKLEYATGRMAAMATEAAPGSWQPRSRWW